MSRLRPVQHRWRFGPVAEVHLVELDAAFEWRQLRRCRRRHFGAGVQDVAQPRHRDAGLLEVGPELRHAHDRLRDALREHVEGDELAHAQLVVHHEPGAVPERGGADEFADQVDAFMAVGRQGLRLEAGRDVGRELVVPAFRDGRLQGAGLDGLDAGHGFDQQRLVLGTARELLVQARAQDGHEHQAQRHVERQAHEHDERERHAVGEHHGDEDRAEQDVEHERERVAGEEAADVLQLAHARHRVADAAGLEVSQGQPQQVAEQPRAEFHVDAARGVAEHVGAQHRQNALEQHDDHEADHEHVERGQAAMHEHLVHHDLEEQRADQAEELQEQRDDEHFAEQLAVLHEARDEPAEVELRELAGERRAAGDEDELAGPLAANASSGSITGRPPWIAPLGSWNSTRWPSHWASTTVRTAPVARASVPVRAAA